jgi:hypothetical protein
LKNKPLLFSEQKLPQKYSIVVKSDEIADFLLQSNQKDTSPTTTYRE